MTEVVSVNCKSVELSDYFVNIYTHCGCFHSHGLRPLLRHLLNLLHHGLVLLCLGLLPPLADPLRHLHKLLGARLDALDLGVLKILGVEGLDAFSEASFDELVV
jgi:hypothetical protein